MDGFERDLQQLIESALHTHLPRSGHEDAEPLNEALRYAVFPGGKRLRPKLTLLAARLVADDFSRALPCGCALEFIHSSSLIFDDLPCMDASTLRRGNAALHLVFGEGLAMLAGIALLNEAYAIFGRTPGLIKEATDCIGVQGMVGGQAADLRSTCGRDGRLGERNRKTSALMRLALTAGPWACGASPVQIERLGYAGECFGRAYQVLDDLADLPSDRISGFEADQARASELVAEGNASLGAAFGSGEAVTLLTTSVERVFSLARASSP